MTLLFMDSFDLYATGTDDTDLQEAGWLVRDAAKVQMTSGGRYGGNTVLVDHELTGGLARLVDLGDIGEDLVRASDTVIIQGSFKLENLANAANQILIRCSSVGGNQCFAIVINTNGMVRIQDENGAYVKDSPTGIVSGDTWHYIEVKAKINKGIAIGRVVVRIDEQQIASVYCETSSGLQQFTDQVTFCGASTVTTEGSYWDDIVIMSSYDDGSGLSNFIGDSRISVLLPDADISTANWTLSAGSDSYALVDDTVPGDHDGDSTYIESSTVDGKTKLSLEDLSGTPTLIHAVGTALAAKKTDAGARVLRSLLFISGVDYEAGQVLSTDYRTLRNYWGVNPNTGAVWTQAEVNALIAGVKIQS